MLGAGVHWEFLNPSWISVATYFPLNCFIFDLVFQDKLKRSKMTIEESFFCHIHLYCTTTASSRVLLYSTYIETQNCPLRFPSQFPHPTVVRTSTSREPDGFCNPVLTLDYVVPLPIMHRMSSQWLSFSGSFAQVLVTLSGSPFSSLLLYFLTFWTIFLSRL